MADRKQRFTNLAITLGLLGLNLIALNVLVSGWSRARVDLTEGAEFSISGSTERILQSLDDDLVIHGFFSKRTHPKLAPLVPRIADLLDEYRALSNGRVKIELVDPGEDEAAEQEANDRFGVRSTPFRLASKYETGIVNAYFALVVQYGDQYEKYGFDDLIEVEPLPDGDLDVRLRNLEYDLTRAIKKVVYGFRNTAELFERVDGPVKLTAIVTPAALPEIFQKLPDAVRAAARELEEAGGGKFAYEEIDPSTPEVEQQVARRFGARPMSLGLFSEGKFYLYGLLQVGDQIESLPLVAGDLTQAEVRELIEAALRRHTPGFLKRVGIVAPQPEIPPELMMQYQMQGMPPPQPPPEFQQVKQFLGQDYQVADVSLTAPTGVAADVDLLVVLKPKNLSDQAVFALDQYLMRGGRVILCAGAYETQFSQQGIQVLPLQTGLEDWLKHLGVEMPRELVLDEQNRPLPIPERRMTPLGTLLTWRMAPYPYLVEVAGDGLVSREMLAGLDAVGVYWGSPVKVSLPEGSPLQMRTVLQSSKESWTSSDTAAVGSLDYTVPEATEPRVLAASLSGRFPSFFAGKEIPGADAEKGPTTVAIEESPETTLMVVGNTEFLSDFVARALGTGESGFFEQNLRFLENAIDFLTLDADMIQIRSRGAAARRLSQIERATEIVVESLNYLVPAALLLAFAAARFLRRRRVAPLVAVSAPAETAAPRSAEA
jgi:ABC-2 type transport system permease protein